MRSNSVDEDDEESKYAESRFNPLLKGILKALLGASDTPLSFEDFPSVLPMPESSSSSGAAASARRKKKHHGGVEGSARKGGRKAPQKGKTAATAFTGGRTIVFTVGGMTYSEMRVARDMMERESREIIYGSTSFLTAKEFVDDLSSLS